MIIHELPLSKTIAKWGDCPKGFERNHRGACVGEEIFFEYKIKTKLKN
jgi:hypothetical protein